MYGFFLHCLVNLINIKRYEWGKNILCIDSILASHDSNEYISIINRGSFCSYRDHSWYNILQFSHSS